MSEKRIDKKKISRQARDDNREGATKMPPADPSCRACRDISSCHPELAEGSLFPSFVISSLSRDLFLSILFSLTPRKGPKEGCYPQGPLHRGMQTKVADDRRLSCLSGIAGHAMALFPAGAEGIPHRLSFRTCRALGSAACYQRDARNLMRYF